MRPIAEQPLNRPDATHDPVRQPRYVPNLGMGHEDERRARAHAARAAAKLAREYYRQFIP